MCTIGCSIRCTFHSLVTCVSSTMENTEHNRPTESRPRGLGHSAVYIMFMCLFSCAIPTISTNMQILLPRRQGTVCSLLFHRVGRIRTISLDVAQHSKEQGVGLVTRLLSEFKNENTRFFMAYRKYKICSFVACYHGHCHFIMF